MRLFKSSPKTTIAAVVAAGTLIGAPLTLNNEGLKLRPYYDGAGVLTWCGGETEVGFKTEFTKQECVDLFNVRYGYYSLRTAELYTDKGKTTITPEAHAAFTDMSYNIGLGAVAKSSMIRNINNGNLPAACESILKYKYAGGKDCSTAENRRVCGGIWVRRLQMRELCLKNS